MTTEPIQEWHDMASDTEVKSLTRLSNSTDSSIWSDIPIHGGPTLQRTGLKGTTFKTPKVHPQRSWVYLNGASMDEKKKRFFKFRVGSGKFWGQGETLNSLSHSTFLSSFCGVAVCFFVLGGPVSSRCAGWLTEYQDPAVSGFNVVAGQVDMQTVTHMWRYGAKFNLN